MLLRNVELESDESVAISALEHGHLEVVKWLHEEFTLKWSNEIFNAAVRFGNIENIKWLLKNGCPPSQFAVEEASEAGHYEVVKWLEDDVRLEHADNDKCWRAAVGGHYDLVKKFHEEGSRLGMNVSIPFARDGNLEGWIRLKEQGAWFSTMAAVAAASEGHLEVLQWLQKNGPKLNIEELRLQSYRHNRKISEWLDTQYDSSPGW